MHYGVWDFIENPNLDASRNEESQERSESSEKDAAENTIPVIDQKNTRRRLERSEIILRKARSYTIINQTLEAKFKPLIATTSRTAAQKILQEHFKPTT